MRQRCDTPSFEVAKEGRSEDKVRHASEADSDGLSSTSSENVTSGMGACQLLLGLLRLAQSDLRLLPNPHFLRRRIYSANTTQLNQQIFDFLCHFMTTFRPSQPAQAVLVGTVWFTPILPCSSRRAFSPSPEALLPVY